MTGPRSDLWTPPQLSERERECIDSVVYGSGAVWMSRLTLGELRARIDEWDAANPTIPATYADSHPRSLVGGIEIRLNERVPEHEVQTPAGLIHLDVLLPAIKPPPKADPMEVALAQAELDRYR